ncbi:peptidase, U32 family [Prevotella disiens FB035-09AN]|uniref:Peptidase, U32 family n=1 Tax=Prevotella disiens FB035-09AN TaxID=866771 RepID=E1KST5_9BACT|nr:U32 family peptidase [Prevotella disiens]EFL45633.1 peptidase, U32 family [Prevotella disiens FB035-09AN]
MRTIELLAPAKNLECGIAAIDHGADAVYIGAAKFGARQSAGNNVEDIATLCNYAHQFGAKVHVTVNTIIYNNEMDDMLQLVRELEKVHVDALLIQDMGLLKACKETLKTKIALHASTQCDSRTAEKVAWLASLGFERVVLARELSVKEISAIHKAVPQVELEAFVHGALCVSYSGICYASQHCFGRSANRGACSQFCRMAFDLKDSDGKIIEKQRYLLSLKDMCQIDNLEELIQSGACAFKIEGRLKDINYVKNVVSAYNKRLNEIVRKYPNQFKRASLGKVEYSFTPDLNKTFNRGYTNYFVQGRQPNIFSPNTPKALGEFVGKVKELRRDSFNVASTASFANGDGLCFINSETKALEGFRVNRAVGNRLFPYKMPNGLQPGMGLYRNQDQAFEKELSGNSAKRLIAITMTFGLTENGYSLEIKLVDELETKLSAKATINFEHQAAQKPQRENIIKQLSKLGNTIYNCENIEIVDEADQYFIPSSILAELRRDAIEQFASLDLAKAIGKHNLSTENNESDKVNSANFSYINPKNYERYPYLYNIANKEACSFYVQQGMEKPQAAFECTDVEDLKKEQTEALVMQCRHCIRYSLGYCVVNGGKKPTWKEPLFLELGDRKRFRLEFDCRHCQMNIFAE